MATVVKSMATVGVDGFMVEIEASTIRGQQQMMSIIGLPDQAIKEAGERIQAALVSCGYEMPKDKTIISLAPGDKKKRGSHFDLGMIIALLFQTKNLIEKATSAGCGIITIEDIAYPKRFRGICDMPTVLFVRGELRINEYERSVGIVGARRCSQEGKEEAIRRAELEVTAASAVVSGMAKGIDSYAHTAAIKNGGYTIAVLGSGPDICYPSEHEKLYGEIIKNGCIVSEYPPGTLPRNYTFPARNRLIAALSDEIVVIDAGAHSGTESTVRAAGRYGRRVEYTYKS